MNRRDFLHPLQLSRSAGDLARALELSPPSQSQLSEIALLRVARGAMGTKFEIITPYGTANALAAATAALDLVDLLEDQLTVYRDSSEVSRLNRLAHREIVEVEAHLFQLLVRASNLTQETAGAFDLAIGTLIKTWGFFRRQGRLPTPEELALAIRASGMRHVAFFAENCGVHFTQPSLELNLGSIGKGYALDRAAELLRRDWNLPSALLHGGHSSVLALGSTPGDSRGWAVGIQHPWLADRRMAVVWLRNEGLGTSAATYQYFEQEGRKLGHLLDPRSGRPAEGIASATAIAPSAAEADALATAFYVWGVEATRRYCAIHPEVSALLLPEKAETPLLIGRASEKIEPIRTSGAAVPAVC